MYSPGVFVTNKLYELNPEVEDAFQRKLDKDGKREIKFVRLTKDQMRNTIAHKDWLRVARDTRPEQQIRHRLRS